MLSMNPNVTFKGVLIDVFTQTMPNYGPITIEWGKRKDCLSAPTQDRKMLVESRLKVEIRSQLFFSRLGESQQIKVSFWM